MRDRKAFTRDLDGGGTWLKVGMARVESEGGLRSELIVKPPLGLEGRALPDLEDSWGIDIGSVVIAEFSL